MFTIKTKDFNIIFNSITSFSNESKRFTIKNSIVSHLTEIKTCFQDLSYLEKALIRLEIPNFKNSRLTKTNSLILPQYKNNDLVFRWDGKSFALNVDHDYWNQEYSVSHFITRIKKEYAVETIVGESQKFGFKPVQIKQNSNGSKVISLQRFTF